MTSVTLNYYVIGVNNVVDLILKFELIGLVAQNVVKLIFAERRNQNHFFPALVVGKGNVTPRQPMLVTGVFDAIDIYVDIPEIGDKPLIFAFSRIRPFAHDIVIVMMRMAVLLFYQYVFGGY